MTKYEINPPRHKSVTRPRGQAKRNRGGGCTTHWRMRRRSKPKASKPGPGHILKRPDWQATSKWCATTPSAPVTKEGLGLPASC